MDHANRYFYRTLVKKIKRKNFVLKKKHFLKLIYISFEFVFTIFNTQQMLL
jgi:hypothetical protein